jgi:hypothetical protein
MSRGQGGHVLAKSEHQSCGLDKLGSLVRAQYRPTAAVTDHLDRMIAQAEPKQAKALKDRTGRLGGDIVPALTRR